MVKKFSLRSIWISLFFLVVIIPAAILLYLYWNTEYNYRLDHSLSHETFLNKVMRENLEKDVKRYITLLQNKSDPMGQLLSQQKNPAAITELLKIVLQREEAVHSLLLISRDKRIIASQHRQLAEMPADRSANTLSPEWIKEHWGLRLSHSNPSPELLIPINNRIYIGAATLHEGRQLLTIAVPVSAAGQPIAVLLARIDVEILWRQRTLYETGRGVVSYVINRRGAMLTEISAIHSGTLLTHLAIVRAGLADKVWDNHQIYKGVLGQDVYGTVVSVPLLNWLIISEIPVQTIVDPILNELLYASLTIIILFLLFLMIGLWVTQRILAQVNHLTQAINHYAQGKEHKPLGESFIKELDMMASSFNTMVADRERIEESLRESEAGLANAQRIAHLGNWELNLQTGELSCSDALYRVLGYRPAQNDASYDVFLDAIHPNDRERVKQAYLKSLQNQRPYTIEYRLCLSDGKMKNILERCETFYDKHDKPSHSVGIIQDITERVITEEALRRSQKMDAVGQLSGGIAHDFNNQLGVMIGYLDMLKMCFKETDNQFKWVSTAHRAAMRCAELTRQLLTFSRYQNQEKRHANMNQMLGELEAMVARSLTPEISVQYKLADDLWDIEVNKGEFQDALLNMVINARDAMSGAGELFIETCNIVIDEDDARQNLDLTPGDYARLSLRDTGRGMDKKTSEHIFEPFFTTKPVGKGTGLGMSMVYGFLKNCNGCIKIYSETDLGTTIHLYFPRSTSSEKIEPVDSFIQSPLPGGNESILIVDDEKDLLELAEKYLTDQGYKTFTAGNGAEAIEVFQSAGHIDLLFSDVVMPGKLNGYELAQELSCQQASLKILLTSGFTTQMVAGKDPSGLSVSLLNKPYRKADLLKRIREILDTKKMPPPTSQAQNTKKSLSECRVLVVDDDEDVRDLYQINLKRSGCHVLLAENGKEAISCYQQALNNNQNIDIVILDLNLGMGLGGVEIAAEIRRIYPHTRIIVSSGNDESDVMKNYRSHGFDAALKKDFRPANIKQLIESLLETVAR